MLRLALLGKVVTAGDDVSLLPQDVLPDAGAPRAGRGGAAQPGQPRSGYAWTSTLLTVAGVEPAGAALVTMDTVVGWQDGARTTRAPRRRRPAAGAGRTDAGGAAAERSTTCPACAPRPSS